MRVGKVIPLAGIDPRRREAPERYRRCIEEYGIRGLKWHPDRGHYPNDEAAKLGGKAQRVFGL